MSIGYICGVPSEVMEVVHTERGPERWCFGERKRRAGTSEWRAPSFEWLKQSGAWGWAEPVERYRCDGCGEDRRWGFGW